MSRSFRFGLRWRFRWSPRLRIFAALIALGGFALQYPIPAVHRCPVLNPEGTAEALSAAEQTYVRSLPSCHQSAAIAALLARKHSAGHDQPAPGHEDAPAGGHDHDTCPVCQSYLHLQLAPTPAILPLLQSSQLLVIIVRHESETIPTRNARFQPPARAPPA